MLRPAQIALGIVAAVLLTLGLRFMFFPDAAQSFTALTPDNGLGSSNLRAMGAPLIMLGIIGGFGAVKARFAYTFPVPLYFLMLVISRIVTLVADGSSPGVIRALVIAVVFFVVAEFALQVFKRTDRRN